MWAMDRHRSPEPRRASGEVAGGHVPVATVSPESIRELYREPFRTRAEPTRSMGRAPCVTIACGLNVGDVSNVLLCAGTQGDVTLTARSAFGNAEPVP